MLDEKKRQIETMRSEGKSYAVIAAKTGMTVSAVKTYCRRNNLGGVRSAVGRNSQPILSCCEQCGKPVTQVKGRKHKRFCSDACRMNWWSNHRDRIHQKTLQEFTCVRCGKHFTLYAIRNRRYCSHACYIQDRFHSEVSA